MDLSRGANNRVGQFDCCGFSARLSNTTPVGDMPREWQRAQHEPEKSLTVPTVGIIG
jgi:hypothetical protein